MSDGPATDEKFEDNVRHVMVLLIGQDGPIKLEYSQVLYSQAYVDGPQALVVRQGGETIGVFDADSIVGWWTQ